MEIKSQNPRFKVFFFFAIFLVYFTVFFIEDKLAFAPVWDETHFWETSLRFSKSLIPDLSLLRNYGQLNTPLPFIVFGALEYLFKGGIFAGRFLNFILSFAITCTIGFSHTANKKHVILAVLGLLLFPYYLKYSTLLYTDIIATFFVIYGFWFYLRSLNILSSIAFILAIASRQYMLVFPVSLVAFEIYNAVKPKFSKHSAKHINTANDNQYKKQSPILSSRVIMLFIASLSIGGWFLLFGGIAPQSGLNLSYAPKVQQSLFAVTPASSLYFLACVGLHFVMPELLLFHTRILFRPWIAIRKLLTLKNLLLAVALILLFALFPLSHSHGLLTKMGRLLPNDFLQLILYYFFALIAAVRFSRRIDIAFWILLVNCGLMMKAYSWDKYVLPLAVVFWYLKSINRLDTQTPEQMVLTNKS
ncbi:MAG: hypothetical protein KI793_13170 [Rivularia sp. (in: Bacteria)]|nr:hypothetical protein [Rivularia sp. MS3]